MAQLEFGLFLEFPTNSDEQVVEQIDRYLPIVQLAENSGFKSVWAGESYPKEMGAIQHTSSPFLLLAYLAPQTSMKLGTGVTLAPIWHPLRLAYDTAMLDQLSHGRLVLGIGLGNPGIWKRFGVERDSVGQRTDETIQALRALWAGEDGFEGDVVKAMGGMSPRPVQPGGPQSLVGGKITRSARRAAQLGDGLMSGTHFEWPHVQRLISIYHTALEELGKDSKRSTVSVNRLVVLAENPDQAWEDAAPYLARLFKVYSKIGLVEGAEALFDSDVDVVAALKDLTADICLVGSPESVAPQLEEYVAAGVTQLQIRPAPAVMPTELVERTIRLAGEQLIPAFG